MAIKEKADTDFFEWTAEDEIQLFFALDGLKPVGINKHFNMALIVDRLSKALNRDISSEVIWSHLRTMYNLKALDELEPLPFPNDQTNFSLPESEYFLKRTKSESSNEDVKKSETKTEGSSKSGQSSSQKSASKYQATKEQDKKSAKPNDLSDAPKRTPKRTRGSTSLETNSPASTPPNTQSSKRRRN